MKTVYLDSYTSCIFFYNRSILFGYPKVALEQCRIFFAASLFLKFVLQIVVTSFEALKLHKIAGASAKSFFSNYNFLFTSVLTSSSINGTANEKQPDDAKYIVTEFKETHINLCAYSAPIL